MGAMGARGRSRCIEVAILTGALFQGNSEDGGREEEGEAKVDLGLKEDESEMDSGDAGKCW